MNVVHVADITGQSCARCKAPFTFRQPVRGEQLTLSAGVGGVFPGMPIVVGDDGKARPGFVETPNCALNGGV